MAKPKKKPADDSPLEAEVEDAVVEEVAEEVEAVEEVALEAADVEVAVEEPALEAVETPPEEPEDVPEPATSPLNLVLFIVNLLLAIGVVYVVIIDYARRHAAGNAILRHDLALQGTPLDDKDIGPASSDEIGWALALESDWLKEAASKRNVRVAEPFQAVHEVAIGRINPADLGDETLKDAFKELNADKEVKFQLDELKALSSKLPGDIEAAAAKISEDVKNDVQKRSLLQQTLLPLARTVDQIQALNDAIRKANAKQLDDALVEAATRRLYADILIPLEIYRSVELKEQIQDVKDRPLDLLVKLTKNDLAAKNFAISLDTLKDLLAKRIEEAMPETTTKRDTVERRRTIAFFLFSLSQVKDPKGEPLYPQDRVEMIVGLQQFIQAADSYAVVLMLLGQDYQTAIARDRGHYLSPDQQRLYDDNIDRFIDGLVKVMSRPHKIGDQTVDLGLGIPINNPKAFRAALKNELVKLPADKRSGKDVLPLVKAAMAKLNIVIVEDPRDIAAKVRVKEALFEREVLRLLDSRDTGFIGAYKELVDSLHHLAAQIQDYENQLQGLKTVEAQRLTHLATREAHAKEITEKLVAGRAESKRLAEMLAKRQQQLFRAQVELADVDLRNQSLEQRIRILERKRGGQNP